LIEFHHSRFDEVEIPGQYVQHVDASEDFVKIARFSPRAELGRGHGHCFRRISMIGGNGTQYTFNVQMPAARHCRREERLTQLFRIMNRSVTIRIAARSRLISSVLKKRKESRRRNLQFHLPTAIPLAPQLRLVQNDQSYISLQDVYDDFATSKGMSREDSLMAFYDRVKALHEPSMSRVSVVVPHHQLATDLQADTRFVQLKADVLEEIQTKLIPQNILSNVS
jgi:transformation/transcription domain-associated protein